MLGKGSLKCFRCACSLLHPLTVLISTANSKEYEGALSFATDAWTSPNHRAYVAVTVHFELKGSPVCLLLDLVEGAESHNGVNLAKAFAKILEEFGIEHKVLYLRSSGSYSLDTDCFLLLDTQHNVRQRVKQRHHDRPPC